MKDIVAKIKSGNKFKIKNWIDRQIYCTPSYRFFSVSIGKDYEDQPLDYNFVNGMFLDLLEGKIELEFEEEKIEITRSHFNEVWKNYFGSVVNTDDRNALADQLGFKS